LVLTLLCVRPLDSRGRLPALPFGLRLPTCMRPLFLGSPTDWQFNDGHNRDMLGIARLKPGVSPDRARAEISALARHLAEIHPDVNQGVGATLLPLWKGHFGAQAWLLAPLQILMSVCAVVLLIVCANVANLLLARFTARQKEFSMRLALGAKRWRLIRQLLTESLIVAAAGAGLGVVIAVWSGQLLQHLHPPGLEQTPAPGLRLDRTVLVFTGLLCIVTTLLCGLVPAFNAVRGNL